MESFIQLSDDVYISILKNWPLWLDEIYINIKYVNRPYPNRMDVSLIHAFFSNV